MAHETNHCDVIDCPSCGDDDRLADRDRAFNWLLLRLDGCTLLGHQPTMLDCDDDTVKLSIDHVVKANKRHGHTQDAKLAFLRHLDELREFIIDTM